MQIWLWIVVAIVVIAVVAAVLLVPRQQRRQRLRGTFGSEYDREVDRRGDRGEAERELNGRMERRRQLDIVPLSAEQRERFLAAWSNVQAHFVDAPHDAVLEADTLITTLMRERGYPMADFDQRAADISVEHPQVVENYRAAHDITQRSAGGRASTEDLRQAMVHYRALFSELAGPDGRQGTGQDQGTATGDTAAARDRAPTR